MYFDITSLSTYSKLIDIAEWGYNRNKEKLKQINIGLVYGNTTEFPLFYNIYQGSITDVTTFENIKKYCNEFGIKKIIYVVDSGFYSSDNIKSLKEEKIMIPLSFSVNRAIELLTRSDSNLQNKENLFIYKDSIYSYYSEKYIEYEKAFTAHIFRNKEMYDESITGFYKQLITIEKKSNEKKHSTREEIEKDCFDNIFDYMKFFEIENKNNLFYLKKNQKKIDAQIQRFGTYNLITNEENLSKEKTLDLHKRKENIENVFDTMKNDMDRDRLHVQSAERAEGAMFLTFISLIITDNKKIG